MTEADLTRKLIKYLKSQGAYAVKIHGNMYTAGLPDIVGCYNGVFLGLEVKKPGRVNTLTKLQAKTLDDISDSGGVACVVTDIEDCDLALLEAKHIEGRL